MKVIRCFRATSILQAVFAPAELAALWRVNAPKADARSVDFQRIAVDDAGLPGEIVGQGGDGRREQHHYNGRRMQQPHRQILRGPSLQVNALGAAIALDDLDFRVAARRNAEVLSDPACANART